MIKGVIFDLDGTILNSIEDIADSANLTMEHFGYPTHTVAAYKRMVGNGFVKLMERAMPEGAETGAHLDEVLSYFYDRYAEHYQLKTMPYDGIREVLQTLQKNRIMLAVNSNKRQDYTERLVAVKFPGINWVDVIGGGAGYPNKPDPSAALAILRQMEADPSEVLYIGDSQTDVMTGKQAGLTVIGVTWGFREQAELEAHGADRIAHMPQELLRMILG